MNNSWYKYSISLFLLVVLFPIATKGQEKGLIFSKYYSPKDYFAGTQNWVITQDKRGVMYIGNGIGVLEFDGENWRKIKVSNESTVRGIDIAENNTIYVGAYNEIGYLAPDNTGELIYNSLVPYIDSSYKDFGEVWSTNCMSDTVFFLTERYLIRYLNGKFDYWESNSERFYLGHKVDNKYLVHEIGNGLLEFKNNNLQLIEGSSFFANKRIHSILNFNGKTIIGTRNNGVFIITETETGNKIESLSEISEQTKELNEYLIKDILYHGIKLSDNLLAFGTIKGNVLIVDREWNVKDIINNEVIGIKSPVQYLYNAPNQALWIGLANGLCEVEILSPFRYWNDKKGLIGSFTDVAELDKKLYISTGSGVYYTSRYAQNTKFEISSFIPVQGNFEQVWGFLYFQPPEANADKIISNRITDKNTLLLASTSKGIFQIIDDKSRLISENRSVYTIYQYKKDPSKLFLGTTNGVALVEYNNNNWIQKGFKFGIKDIIREVAEDSLGNLWFSASYKGLYRVKNPFNPIKDSIKVEFFDTSYGLPSVQAIHLSRFLNEIIFVIDYKYYSFNDSLKKFTPYTPDWNLIQEPNDVDAEEPIDTFSYLRIITDLTTDEYVISDEDPYVWYGATFGTIRYDGFPQRDFLKVYPPIIRQVFSDDSLIFGGTNFSINRDKKERINIPFIIKPDSIVNINTVLEYQQNSLMFLYAFPFFEEAEKNLYSYYLEGYDKNWSEWSLENKRVYTNLPEGDYIFKVKARNIYYIESPVAEFHFTILPPWYRTFSAFIGYSILGILFIILVVKLYTYRLIKEKDKLEKIVIERTQEILMQKEEILVQAEHLKDANQEISARNEELKKQKYEITNQAIKLKKANLELNKLSKVASETDNAIMIFDKDGNLEWVNDGFTRIYGYTLEEFKKERSSNIVTSSSNPNIKEAILSCINDKKSVVYKFNTKSKTGKEIWVQTTLTNVTDKDGNTTNFIAIESDITELKQAEIEIAAQRDQLVIANAIKNKFFRIIAHDLRNPISTLAGSTSLILNDFDIFNKEQTRNFIGELNKLSQTTYNLLENLLDWATTQTGEMKFNPKQIDVLSLLKENIELIKRRIDDKGIKLTIDVPENTLAFADENMVKTIIRNLLSNAVKFTPEKGEISISANTEKDYITCEVTDNGIGISDEDLQKLFKIDQHYTRLGLSNEKGSGLGLILCKEFVERNGGFIQVVSAPDKGTTIKFTLKKFNS